MDARYELGAEGIRVAVDPSVGHLALFEVDHGGRTIAPLHRAPWLDDKDTIFPAETPPNVRRLSGDFLCAPFGRNDIEPAPSHGWPANSPWRMVSAARTGEGAEMVLELERPVFGARVVKHLRLRHGHPFLYQEHRFVGGKGALSVAHHVMVHMAEGGTIAVSPKLFSQTPPTALEPDPARGRSILSYPAQRAGFGIFPLAAGGSVDLRRYPPGERHEEFLTLAEAPSRSPGWTLVTRHAERDRVLVAKRTADLPLTMLWMSNGGRDYEPWSGRHLGVLGIEDACASPLGHRDSISDNDFTRRGIRTALSLGEGTTIRLRQAIGAFPAEGGGAADVTFSASAAVVETGEGRRDYPFDTAFLA